LFYVAQLKVEHHEGTLSPTFFKVLFVLVAIEGSINLYILVNSVTSHYWWYC